jgi:hypothetical protein
VKKHLFLFFVIAIITICCAETREIYFNDPTIRVRFINASSIAYLNDSLESANDSILIVADAIMYYSDSLKILTDSILVLIDSIDNGKNEYIQTKDDLSFVQIDFANQIISLEETSENLSEIKSQLTSTIKAINTGKLLVSSISNLNSGLSLNFSDSTTDYYLPMSMNSDNSSLAIEIDNNSYNIELGYEREEIWDDKRRIRLSISDLGIRSHGFDSVSCESLNCENETPVKFYF